MFANPHIAELVAQYRKLSQLEAARLSNLVEIADAGYTVKQIAKAFTVSRHTAALQLDLALAIVRRLPAVHAAMAAGDLDLPKASLIAKALVAVKDDYAARSVAAAILPDAPTLNTDELRARLSTLIASDGV